MCIKLAVSLPVALVALVALSACGATTAEPAPPLADASSLDSATATDGRAGADASADANPGPADAASDRSPPGGPCNTDDECAAVRFICLDGGLREIPNRCESDGMCTAFPVCHSPSCSC